jgi:hypothetical protein
MAAQWLSCAGRFPHIALQFLHGVRQRQGVRENIVKLQETTAKSFDHVVPFSVHAWMKQP